MATAIWPAVAATAAASQTVTTAANFIPEIWRDEVLISRESNLVAAKAFRRINHNGKKGDTIHIPLVSDFSAVAKSAATGVTIQANTEGKKDISLNKHYEISFLLEDIVKFQSSYDLRKEFTSKAGYGLAKQIDTDILALYASLGTSYQNTGADGTTAYAAGNEGDLTDASIRAAMELLDNNDVPENDRFLLIPPSQKNVLLGIDKFTLWQNIGRTSELQKGMFGEIYGMKVMTTTNCATAGNSTVAMLAQRDAIACAMQHDVRVQAQYKQEYLATLVTADVLYGVKILRGDNNDTTTSNNRKSHAVALHVPT